MNRKTIYKIGCGVITCIGIACMWKLYGSHTVAFDEAAIQRQIDRQIGKDFPVSGKAGLLVKSATLTGASVHIRDGRVITDLSIQGKLIGGKRFALGASAEGVPEFMNGAFYFRPNTIDFKEVEYQGAAPSELASKFAERYVSNEKAARFINDAAPKAQEWMTGVAERAAMQALNSQPVYRPGDDIKGVLIKASLQSVTVGKDSIVVTFTLWRLTVSILTGLIMTVAGLGCLIALCMDPRFNKVGSALSWVG